ncbi:hypothetical protein QYF36_015500 [Acer negundo]|nr:hypothetical protein QYF36_015500 [Acer negundo]
MIGEVRELDLETNSDVSGRFLRVRVTVQAKEPLHRLGHVKGEYTDMRVKGEILTDANEKLTVWIRAVSPKRVLMAPIEETTKTGDIIRVLVLLEDTNPNMGIIGASTTTRGVECPCLKKPSPVTGKYQ